MKIIEVIKYNQHKDTVDEFNRLDTAGERIREFKSNRKISRLKHGESKGGTKRIACSTW